MGFLINTGTSTPPVAAKRVAVSITCSSVSALQGPEMIRGRLLQAAWVISFAFLVAVASITNMFQVIIYSILPAIRIVHPDTPALVVLPVDSPDHLWRRFFIHFYPAVHFLHIDPAQHLFPQFAHVQDELEEAGFVEPILRAQVDKQPGIISAASVEISCGRSFPSCGCVSPAAILPAFTGPGSARIAPAGRERTTARDFN